MRWIGLTIALVMGVPRLAAAAEWQIEPFIGLTFAGDTTLVTLLPPDDTVGKNPIVGVSGMWLGDVLGLEAELAHAPGYFSDSRLVIESSVTTVMGHIVVAVPRRLAQYTLRPYVAGGFGLMHIAFKDTVEIFGSRNKAALSLGGGATGFLSDRVGLSWDVRYIRSLGGDLAQQGQSFESEKLSYWRATMGVVFRPTSVLE